MHKLNFFITILTITLFCLAIAAQVLLPSINYWQSDNVIGWKHTPGFSGVFCGTEFKTKVKFNKEGFRDRDHQIDKDKRVLRIAVMGDSFVEALQVNQEDMLTAVLERSLNSVMKTEVMNFGVSTFGTTNEYLTYEAYVKKYRPDFIVIIFSVNDFIDNDKTLSSRMPTIDLMKHRPYFSFTRNGELAAEEFSPYKKGILKSAFSKIKILSFLRNRFFKFMVQQHSKKQPFLMNEIQLYSDNFTPKIENCVNLTEAVLKNFLSSILDNGSIPIVCLSFPAYLIDPYHKNLLMQCGLDLSEIKVDKPFNLIKGLCNSLNVDVVDAGGIQLQIYNSSPQTLFFKEGHWNENGHKAIAGVIESKIIDQSGSFSHRWSFLRKQESTSFWIPTGVYPVDSRFRGNDIRDGNERSGLAIDQKRKG